MTMRPLAIRRVGLVTAVGSDASSSCAAFRAKTTNPGQTPFMDSTGEWIAAHQVWPEAGERGIAKLARMAATAIEEALDGLPKGQWADIPLLLCVAESERVGRPENLDIDIFEQIEALTGARFAPTSGIVPYGRVGVAVALAQAAQRVEAGVCSHALVAATDGLLDWHALMHYDREDRLLTRENSNGFMPGEGAGALLVGPPGGDDELLCTGIGFAVEPAPIASGEPLRGDGLSNAILSALAQTGQTMHAFDYRIADLSGEQYYFKEAALALLRTLRTTKEEFDLWHPAECTGEAGALAGAAIIALADAACRKGYGKGPNIVAHMANDGGQRAALTLEYRRA